MTDSITLTGKVAAGKLICDPVEFAIAMQQFEGKDITATFERVKNRRTPRANARHWTVIVPLVRAALNLKRPDMLPLNKNQTHYLMATAFGGSEETELGLAPIPTHTMDKPVFHHMDEQATLWLSERGFHVPLGREESVAQAIKEACE